MKANRILFHHRIRADDGQAVHVRELIGALRQQGHQVLECALVSMADSPSPKANGRRSRWQRLALPRWLTEVLEIGYSRRGLSMLLKAGRKFPERKMLEFRQPTLNELLATQKPRRPLRI